MSLTELMKNNPISSLKTLCICLAFMSVGLQAGILGPALLDLKIQTSSSDLSSVTWIVTGRGIGFALGSAIAGTLEPIVNLQCLMACALGLSGLMYAIIPLTKLLWVSIACGSLAGVFQGIVDTASNVLVLKIWSSDCPPFLQAVFSSYGIGSLLGPMIVRPFLILKEDEVDGVSFSQTLSGNVSNIDVTTNQTVSSHLAPKFVNSSNCVLIDGHCPSDVDLLWPFLVTVIFPTVIAASFVYLFIAHPQSLKRDLVLPTFQPHRVSKNSDELRCGQGNGVAISHSSVETNTHASIDHVPSSDQVPSSGLEKKNYVRTLSYQRQISAHSHKRTKSTLSNDYSTDGTKDDHWSPAKIVVIVLVSTFAFFFTGMEQGIGTYIPAFGVGSDLRMRKPSAAAVSSLFWGSLTLFQLVSIPVTSWIGIQKTIWLNLINSVCAGILFLLGRRSETVFMIACAYIGISYASTWGALFAFMETRFNVTGLIVAILTISSCAGQSLAVAVIGILIDTMPLSFPISVLVSNVTMFILFIIIYIICRKYFPKRR